MNKRIYTIIILLLIAGMIIGGICIRKKGIDDAYNYASALITDGSYEEALSELEKANHGKIDREDFIREATYKRNEPLYKNTFSLYAYALAQIEYNSDDVSLYVVNNYLELIPENYKGELSKEIMKFKADFKPEYEKYVAEKERIAELERQKQIQETKERLKKSIPYEGMSESYINYTLMGNYHDKERVIVGKGKRSEFSKNEYRWKNSSGKTILYVECRDGVVTDVSKYWEDKYWTSDGKPIYSGQREGYSSSSNGKKKVYNDDSYNVNDYYDAEDFYEDYYDDFYDYEDAEDYFDENRDW